jgi:hypothetical protein
MHVGVEPASRHETAAQVDTLGTAGVASEIGSAAGSDHAAIADEESFSGDSRSDVHPAAMEQRGRH